MMRNKLNTLRRAALVLLHLGVLTGMAPSCTEVDLCHAPMPHRGELDFRFNWNDEFKQLFLPESMKVVGVRPVNLMRYEFQVSSDEQDNHGTLIRPEEERTPYLPTEPGWTPQSQDHLWVHAGEWNFATYAWNDDMLHQGMPSDEEINADATPLPQEDEVDTPASSTDEGETVDSPDTGYDEMTDVTIGSNLTPITLSYNHYPVNAPQITRYFGEWKDFNAYNDYICGMGMPIYFAYSNRTRVPVVDDSIPPRITVEFTPQRITQRVDFKVLIDKTPNLVVDSVVAEISGVPACIEVTTGYILPKPTYKMLFHLTYGELSPADSLTSTLLTCTGGVDVTGVVRSVNEEMLTGPGILRVAIYTHASYTTAQGEQRMAYKVFPAGINLYNTLRQVKPLIFDADLLKYQQRTKQVLVEVDRMLHVNFDAIVDDGSSQTGLDRWVPGEPFELDVF